MLTDLYCVKGLPFPGVEANGARGLLGHEQEGVLSREGERGDEQEES
jgi:hypothetical protein